MPELSKNPPFKVSEPTEANSALSLKWLRQCNPKLPFPVESTFPLVVSKSVKSSPQAI
jgi:hypothetical protein